jgi:DNA mismatch repair ATPase MutS
MGARLLRNHLHSPLTCVAEINKRLDIVEELVSFRGLDEIRSIISESEDLERALGRLFVANRDESLGGLVRYHSDLLSVGRTLNQALQFRCLLATAFPEESSLSELRHLLDGDGLCARVAKEIEATISLEVDSNGFFVLPHSSQEYHDRFVAVGNASDALSDVVVEYRNSGIAGL